MSCLEKLELKHPNETYITRVSLLSSRTETRPIISTPTHVIILPSVGGAKRIRLKMRVEATAQGKPFTFYCRCGVGVRRAWIWVSNLQLHTTTGITTLLTLITITELLRILREI